MVFCGVKALARQLNKDYKLQIRVSEILGERTNFIVDFIYCGCTVEHLVILFSSAISTQMFSYHHKNVHSYIEADDRNRFFFPLQNTFALES